METMFKVGDLVRLKGQSKIFDPLVVIDVWTNARGEVQYDCQHCDMGKIMHVRVIAEVLVPAEERK